MNLSTFNGDWSKVNFLNLMMIDLRGNLRSVTLPREYATEKVLRDVGDIYAERSERGAADMELLSVTMNGGVMQRSEIEGKDNSSEDKSNYKVVRKGDMVYNSMRMWQAGLLNPISRPGS